MDLWSWLTATPASAWATGLGTLTLAGLFATNRILTLGQHNSRIADLKEYHVTEAAQAKSIYDAMVAAKDAAYAEMKESRDYYRNARLEERDRADRATDQLVETSELARTSAHLLTSLKELAEGAAP